MSGIGLSSWGLWLAQGAPDFENIIWIIFLFLWGIYQLFFASKKEEEKPDEEDAEAAERARRIQDEIRRRIEERKRGVQPSEKPSQEEQPRRERAPSRRELKPRPEYTDTRPAYEEPQPEPVATGGYQPYGDYEAQLRERQRQLEEARKERERMHQQAQAMLKKARSSDDTYYTAKVNRNWDIAVESPRMLRRDVLEALSDPNGLRKAILYQEILGPPLGNRKEHGGWKGIS